MEINTVFVAAVIMHVPPAIPRKFKSVRWRQYFKEWTFLQHCVYIFNTCEASASTVPYGRYKPFIIPYNKFRFDFIDEISFVKPRRTP